MNNYKASMQLRKQNSTKIFETPVCPFFIPFSCPLQNFSEFCLPDSLSIHYSFTTYV